jgi:hypothetical protein
LLTLTGEKAIELIKAGDSVLSRDHGDPNGIVEAKVVEEIFVRAGEIIEITVRGQRIRTTREHPFYVDGQGWTCAFELKPGNQLVSDIGQRITVESIIETGEVAPLYNIRVADFHTYFVGSRSWGFSVWVHNAEYVIRIGADGKISLFYESTGAPVLDAATGRPVPSFGSMGELTNWMKNGNNFVPPPRIPDGKWVNESTAGWSERAKAYQEQITGKPAGQAYEVNGRRFDGPDPSGNGLVDAKGPGYAIGVKNGRFQKWYQGADGLLKEARGQLAAAPGTKITWHVAEEQAAIAIRNLFKDNGITGIDVVHTPPTVR